MASAFLHDHPELQPFVLSNVRLTGKRIGGGAYGSVEEVEIPGATCAAKKIHDIFQDRSEIPEGEIARASRQFVVECQLMSTLRHPHIVQFLGVCFLPGSRLPALVMERLVTSLHELLDPEMKPETPDAKPYIPLGLKCSILRNVTQGLSFLLSHSPPIIHRDLSARNVLLDSAMVAKIADLGMARIVPSLRAATMTKAPGASIYMPPEALGDESRYDMTIDIFSFGVLAIFVLSQTFPNPLSATYVDARGMMVGLTELERRGKYMKQIQSQLRNGHPLILMIQRCLKNRPQDRPTIHQVSELLDQARTETEDVECDKNKLELVQTLREKTRLNEEEVHSMAQQRMKKDAKIQQLQSSLDTRMEQIKLQHEVIQSQQKEIKQLRQQLPKPLHESQSTDHLAVHTIPWHKPLRKSQSSGHAAVHSPTKPLQGSQSTDHLAVHTIAKSHQRSHSSDHAAVHGTALQKPLRRYQSSSDYAEVYVPALQYPLRRSQSTDHLGGHGTAVQPLKWPLQLKWIRKKDLPFGIFRHHVVFLNGMVYVGGGNSSFEYHVLQYNPRSAKWSKLPISPVRGFAMASLKGQLVLVGDHGDNNDRITVWDSTSGWWVHPYPALPTGRSYSAAVGYQDYLIVACGYRDMDIVDVLDTSSGRWYSAPSVTMGGYVLSSALVGDHWYLSSWRWTDELRHIFYTHIPTLISSAMSDTQLTSVWQELPTPPVEYPTLLALQSHLLLVGGTGMVKELYCYSPQCNKWEECGKLPVGMIGPSCAVLPSGEIMVAGGFVKDDEVGYSKQAWIGQFNT